MTAQVPTAREAERVADRIRGLMAERRISQSALAESIGLSRAAMGRRFTGQIALDLDDLAAIARVLEIPMSSLFIGLNGSDQ